MARMSNRTIGEKGHLVTRTCTETVLLVHNRLPRCKVTHRSSTSHTEPHCTDGTRANVPWGRGWASLAAAMDAHTVICFMRAKKKDAKSERSSVRKETNSQTHRFLFLFNPGS